MSPNAGGGGAGSQPMRTAVHITWHGEQINFGDLTPYLTFAQNCQFLNDPYLHFLSRKATFVKCFLGHIVSTIVTFGPVLIFLRDVTCVGFVFLGMDQSLMGHSTLRTPVWLRFVSLGWRNDTFCLISILFWSPSKMSYYLSRMDNRYTPQTENWKPFRYNVRLCIHLLSYVLMCNCACMSLTFPYILVNTPHPLLKVPLLRTQWQTALSPPAIFFKWRKRNFESILLRAEAERWDWRLSLASDLIL